MISKCVPMVTSPVLLFSAKCIRDCASSNCKQFILAVKFDSRKMVNARFVVFFSFLLCDNVSFLSRVLFHGGRELVFFLCLILITRMRLERQEDYKMCVVIGIKSFIITRLTDSEETAISFFFFGVKEVRYIPLSRCRENSLNTLNSS